MIPANHVFDAVADANWSEGVWADAIAKSIDETGLDAYPEDCPWTIEETLSPHFYPD